MRKSVGLLMVLLVAGCLGPWDENRTLRARVATLSAKVEEASCKAERGVVATTCALYRASEAGGSKTPANPSDYSNSTLYGDGVAPSCPTGGVWTYNTMTGRVTCEKHPN